MRHKIYLFACLLFFTSRSLYAQTIDVHFNGHGFMDNREYSAYVDRSNTYFGIRTMLDFGLNLDSINHFRVGVNGLHEFGAKPFFAKVNPVIYYNYTNKGWEFNIGAFPRKGLLDDYPVAILNDTLNYFRPNVEGMLARYSSAYGHETIWIDWVSRQTNTDHEQFIFGLSGKYIPKPGGPFFISHYFMMLHDAHAAIQTPNDHIRDNGAAQVRLGLDLSKKTFLDSLTIEAGGMLSLERTRNVTGFSIPKGFVANLYLGYKRFGLNNAFYAGKGHTLDYGDSFYEKKIYNRLDLSWTPFLFGAISGKFVFSFHQSPGNLSDSQQAFFLTYDLGRKKIAKFK